MKILLTNGNSWTFGSDLNSPRILAEPGELGFGKFKIYKWWLNDTSPENDNFRIPKIWPTKLAKSLGLKNINLAWPSRSNDIICTSTIGWVLDYLSKGGKPDDLLVVVGWGGPEWKHHLLRGDNSVISETIWPEVTDEKIYKFDNLLELFHLYRDHLNVEQEFITRYVENNFHLHNFLESLSIKHLFFNCYWIRPGVVEPHLDIDISEIIEKWRSATVINNFGDTWSQDDEVARVLRSWESIPDSVLKMKNTMRTFRWYIDNSLSVEQGYTKNSFHPSPESHALWAQHLKLIL